MRLYRDQHHRGLAASCVVTVGVFDGLHRGHQALVSRCRERMRSGDTLAMVSFEPMPLTVLAPERAPARLASLRDKLELVRSLGVDLLWLMRFNRQLAECSAAGFAALLRQGLNARHVVVGADFRFGHRREGDFARLQELGTALGYTAERLPAFQVAGERVSSTAIRSALAAGRLDHAARLLGRRYTLSGRVVRGRALGRKLGFPTANLRLPGGRSAMSGVFAVRARVGGNAWRDGVANLGNRPAVGGGEPLLEVHLFDFDGDLYGRRMEVEFVHKLREEAHYDDLGDLVAQMHEDERQARAILARSGEDD